MNKNKITAMLCSAAMISSCGSFIPASSYSVMTASAASTANNAKNTKVKSHVQPEYKIPAQKKEDPATPSYVKDALADITVKSVYVEVTSVKGFYYYHEKEFDNKQIDKAILYINGDNTYITLDISDKIAFGKATPANTYDKNSADFRYDIPLYYNGETLFDKDGNVIISKGDELKDDKNEAVTAETYIGIKGDTNLDKVVNFEDASIIMDYYTELATGKEPNEIMLLGGKGLAAGNNEKLYEDFSAFLSDVDLTAPEHFQGKEDRRLDALDASWIASFYSLASIAKYSDDSVNDPEKIWSMNGTDALDEITNETVDLSKKTDSYNSGTFDPEGSEVKPHLNVTKMYIDDPSDAAGKIVTVKFDLSGANLKYASSAFHVYWDDRLELITERNNIFAEKGRAISDLSALQKPAAKNGVFLCTFNSDNDYGKDGTMWEINFKLPNNVKGNDVFPIDVVYENNAQGGDLFANSDPDSASSRLMQAYFFTKGINSKENPSDDPILVNAGYTYADGYIAVGPDPDTTTIVSSTTTSAITTTTATTRATDSQTKPADSTTPAITTTTATTRATASQTKPADSTTPAITTTTVATSATASQTKAADTTTPAITTTTATTRATDSQTKPADSTTPAITTTTATTRATSSQTKPADTKTEVITTTTATTSATASQTKAADTTTEVITTTTVTPSSASPKTTAKTETTVAVPLSVDKTNISLLSGDQHTIIATGDGIVYKSNNNDVAVVSPDGIITAIAPGNAVINVIDSQYNVVQINVTVNKISSGNDISSPDNGRLFGDINGDNIIDGRDASLLLTYYAKTSTGYTGTLEEFVGIKDSDDTPETTAETSSTTSATTTTETAESTPIATTTTVQTENGWKQSYLKTAADFEAQNTESVYKLLYLNGDKIPELYINNKYDAGELWTIINGEAVKLHSWASSRQNGIMSYSETDHKVMTNAASSARTFAITVWGIADNGNVQKLKTFNCTEGEYSINGSSVSEAEFKAAFSLEEEKMTSIFEKETDLTFQTLKTFLNL
ncbi:MAG: cellulose-binding protein CttA-related protein [Ruminococcus sp.]|nr:cellulose-binding protein CttA-related protein [Ruminococcus sp.]